MRVPRFALAAATARRHPRRAALAAGFAVALIVIGAIGPIAASLGRPEPRSARIAPLPASTLAAAVLPSSSPAASVLDAAERSPGAVSRRTRDRARRTARPRRAPGIDRIPMTARSADLFMPLYRRASATFGVSWRLIASIHQQETSFSSAHGTYHGLNFARCCAGPMQFNVTNGPVTTWDRFRNAYRRAERPARYPHRTRRHPSVYDDFDAIMAAAALLRANGAGAGLDGTAWLASYHYYGHDLYGLQYADQVLARAVGWARRGVCVECPVDAALAGRFDASFAAPYRRVLLAAERTAKRERARKARERRERRARARRARARRERAARRAARRRAAEAAAHRRAAAKRAAERRAAADKAAAKKAAKPAPKPAPAKPKAAAQPKPHTAPKPKAAARPKPHAAPKPTTTPATPPPAATPAPAAPAPPAPAAAPPATAPATTVTPASSTPAPTTPPPATAPATTTPPATTPPPGSGGPG